MPLMGSFSSSSQPIAKLMAFVDGGYLRGECANRFDEEIDYQKLKESILSYFNSNCNGKYAGDLNSDNIVSNLERFITKLISSRYH